LKIHLNQCVSCQLPVTMSSNSSTRSSSLVPSGFLSTAHPIFFDYMPPCVEVKVCDGHDGGSVTDKLTPNCGQPPEEVASTIQSTSSPSVQNTSICGTIPIDPEHCSICLSSHSIPITLVSCCHSFCRDCILVWFRKKAQCPLCKSTSNYFVQSNTIIQSSASSSSSSSSSVSSSSSNEVNGPSNKAIKVWAIYADGDELLPLESIHRSMVSPAIRVHTRRFLSPTAKPLPCPEVATGSKRLVNTGLSDGDHNQEHPVTSKRRLSKNDDLSSRVEIAGDAKSNDHIIEDTLMTKETDGTIALTSKDREQILKAVDESLEEAMRQLKELEEELT